MNSKEGARKNVVRNEEIDVEKKEKRKIPIYEEKNIIINLQNSKIEFESEKITEIRYEILDYIEEELGYFKLNRNSMGYEYLIEAICIVTENQLAIKDFNNNVYFKIAKKYSTDPKKVNWCLSKLVDLMYLNTDNEIIKEYFRLKYYEKPSAKAFIIRVAKNAKRKVHIINN